VSFVAYLRRKVASYPTSTRSAKTESDAPPHTAQAISGVGREGALLFEGD
jgi:hypothetical protein